MTLRLWVGAAIVLAFALVAVPVTIATEPSTSTVVHELAPTLGVLLIIYVLGCLLARRIGMLMANRYLEADLPKP